MSNRDLTLFNGYFDFLGYFIVAFITIICYHRIVLALFGELFDFKGRLALGVGLCRVGLLSYLDGDLCIAYGLSHIAFQGDGVFFGLD